VVLLATQGLRSDEIARRLNSRREIVSKWRKRFFEERLSGVEQRERSGRGPVFPPELVVAVKAIACELPRQLGLPLSRLQVPDIKAAVLARGLVASISGSTIWRWLSEDAIRPGRHRSWIFPRDPNFAESWPSARPVRSEVQRPAAEAGRIRHSIYLKDPDGYTVEMTTYET